MFLVGAASLGVEIAVARLVAPFFGASTIVWANTIAIVLLALATGYWLGGRWSDRHPDRRRLDVLVLAAGTLLAIVPLVSHPFLDLSIKALDTISAGVFAGSLAAVLVLVALPLLLLGAVSPWAVRLQVERVEHAGDVTGRLYATSTAGSLAGVFLAALVLIPFAGTHRTFLVFALVLCLAGAVGLPRVTLAIPLVVAGLLLLPPGTIKPVTSNGGRVIAERETPYQYARVIQYPNGVRELELDEGLAVHSRYIPGSYLTHGYWDNPLVLPLATLGRPARSIAILGSAAGTMARAYHHFFPAARVDAVELDGELVALGRRYFGLRPAPDLHLYVADARPYLRTTRQRYEAIVVDAYRQPYIPFYLVTHEFFALAKQHLQSRGLLIVNVGHPPGSCTLVRAISATLRSDFPVVGLDVVDRYNTLVLASRTTIDAPQVALAALRLPSGLRSLAVRVAAAIRPAPTGGPVWTDDRAPVEWLIDGSILHYAASAQRAP